MGNGERHRQLRPARLPPSPQTEHERAAGCWWELSMRQVETSRALLFDAPRRARSFFP